MCNWINEKINYKPEPIDVKELARRTQASIDRVNVKLYRKRMLGKYRWDFDKLKWKKYE